MHMSPSSLKQRVNVVTRHILCSCQASSSEGLPASEKFGLPVYKAVVLAQWIYGVKENHAQPSPPFGKLLTVALQDKKMLQLSQFASVYCEETNTLFLVWQGTDSVLDLLADASFVDKPWPGTGISVHSGVDTYLQRDIVTHFSKLQQCFDDIASGSITVDSIIITGHSLGGGMAMLALAQFALAAKANTAEHSLRHERAKWWNDAAVDKATQRVVETNRALHQPLRHIDRLFDKMRALTFGAPMVMTSAPDWLRSIMVQKATNFVNCNDVVPRLPGCISYVEQHLDGTLDSLISEKMQEIRIPSLLSILRAQILVIAKGKALSLLRAPINNTRHICGVYQHFCELAYLGDDVAEIKVASGFEDCTSLLSRFVPETSKEKQTLLRHHSVERYVDMLNMLQKL